jgi:Fe-S cluster assembly ATP-binding protein
MGLGVVVSGALRSIAIDEAPAALRGATQGLINIFNAVGTLLAERLLFVPSAGFSLVLAEALVSRGRSANGLENLLRAEAARIGLNPDLLHRALNVDLSGGEKKRNETLQLAVLEPKFAILDELDSGLDIDALRDCARRVEAASNAGLGVLAITHYSRLFEELKPDMVHILVKGRVVASGSPELADELERDGYANYLGNEPEESAPAKRGGLDDLFAL